MAEFKSSTTTIASSDSTVTTLSPDQRIQATQGAQLTAVIQSLYSLVLYDTERNVTLVMPGLDPHNRTQNAEYFFRVPPKVHEFDEPFATTITNTQYAGKYVESYGSVIKSVRLSGTTGLRPNKVAPKTIPLLGISQAQIDTLLGRGLNSDLRTIPKTEGTGHDDIIFLRNIFRAYSDLKSKDLAGKIVMLWRNLKDADYWIVEPEDFKLSQSSGSPLTYEYSISLRTLARFGFTYVLSRDPLEEARRAQRWNARVQEYGQNVLNMFLVISHQVNRAVGFINFLSSTVLAPMLNVLTGVNTLVSTSQGAIRSLKTQLSTLHTNLDEAITRIQSIPGLEAQDPLLHALRRAWVSTGVVLVEPVFRGSPVSDLVSTLNRRSRSYETQRTATTPRRSPTHSPSYIGSEAAPASVSSDFVRPGEDIRDIAARLLGDRARWRLLVTLNALRSPFISALGGPGILMPGDTILVPGDAPKSNALVGANNVSSDETNGDPQANSVNQLAYGRDLRLKSEFFGSEELTDLVINQRGDLGSIQGVANVEQAIRIKFSTQQGELPAHPKFGARFAIGRKSTPASFAELRVNTMSTLLSDTRVHEIKDLQFVSSGDVLSLAANVVLVNSQDSMTTSFALRRF